MAGHILIAADHFAGDFHCDARSRLVIEYGGPDLHPVTRFAAAELERYLSQILRIDTRWQLQEINLPVRSYRIQMREESLPRVLAPASPRVFPNTSEDESQIDVTAHSVALTATNAGSLLNAVYQLLEEQGCLWLFPGAAGEVVPNKEALTIPGGIHRRHAAFPMRGLYPVENLSRYSSTDVRDTVDWMAKNGFNYFVVTANYGWDRLGKVIVEECHKRNIRVAAYLWSFEIFLPLELGKQHPEYFAEIGGRRRVDYNIKRCASSSEAIQLYVKNGVKWLREHPEIDEFIITPNDGYQWCECDKCRLLKPKDQWAAFFVPLFRAALADAPQRRIDNMIYVFRYDLPKNIKPYQDPRMNHFFDVLPRNRWFTLRDQSIPFAKNTWEAKADGRALSMSWNSYLADRLRAWRAVTPGRIWVFEDLMVHASYSIPMPNLALLAEDLGAARKEGIQGYVFESYVQGWNSFASDLWSLGRLCSNPQLDAAALERAYLGHLLGDQASKITWFYDEFRDKYLAQVRNRQDMYWMYSFPELAREYGQGLRSIDPERLNPAGRAWLARQLQVAEVMKQIVHGNTDYDGWAFLLKRPAPDILKICREALKTGRAMDGVFLAYEQLRGLFNGEFGSDEFGFCPNLPASFDPEVRALYGRCKLWDTLAEWEVEGKFPQNPDDPDLYLREILNRAIANAQGSLPSLHKSAQVTNTNSSSASNVPSETVRH
jgi:hypothetical protein